MSHYALYALDITDEQTLIGALIACGYNRQHIEVHQEAVLLKDFLGRNTHYLSRDPNKPDMAHIVIRRMHTGSSMANDIGFVRQNDGTYAAIVSDNETATLHIGRVPFVKAVQKQYGRLNLDKNLHYLMTNIIPGMQLSNEISQESEIRIDDSENQLRVYAVGV